MKKKITFISIVAIVVMLFVGIESHSTADIGYGVYKLTDSDAAGTVVGGAAGGALAYEGGEIGAETGLAFGGPIGAAIGGGIGAL